MKEQCTKALLTILFSFILCGCTMEPEEDKSTPLANQESVQEQIVQESEQEETTAEDSTTVLGVGVGLQDESNVTEQGAELKAEIASYQENFDAIEQTSDIAQSNYNILEDQIFPIMVESFGSEEYSFIPAIERKYRRLAIFIADAEGNIIFKTNDLETNNRILGQLEQPTTELAAVTFSDLNRDGKTDIILITKCLNETGDYAWKPYKVGDVLFQGEQTFYRDWRISDKINRFSMNKSVNCIIAYVRDGKSTEFLYTATTLDELKQKGFNVIEEQDYARRFEKLGKLQVVPGTYRISEYDIFMIYLVDEQGNIVWCFQPMKTYDNLYTLRGITGKDVDGDGMKDLVVLARYTYEGPEGELLIQSDCAIYYQRTDGFFVDTEFSENYICTEEDTMEELVPKIRAFWGWQVEEEETTDDDSESGEE